MRLYVIGPVTGLPDLNREAFAAARARLAAAGHNARVPHDFIPADATRERAMRLSLHELLDRAEGVALLDGWERSAGARVEFEVAAACGIPAMGVGCWDGRAR